MNEDEVIVPPVTPDEPAPEPAAEAPQDPANPAPEPTEPSEEVVLTPEEQKQLVATNKKLFERAKNAEAALKAAKAPKTPTAPAPVPATPQTGVEETVLLANGMDEELLKQLKDVAKARGIPSLIKAQTDPIFVAVKDKFEKDKKIRDASLRPTPGGGSGRAPKTLNTPGLSRDEHKKMALEALEK